jgi:putative flippase GtrA
MSDDGTHAAPDGTASSGALGASRDRSVPLSPRLARFLGVGVVNTLVSFAVFRIGGALLPDRPGTPTIAQVGATAIAMAVSYALNRRWTFRSDAARRREALRFVAQQLAMLASSALLLELAIGVLRAPPTASWLVVTAALTGINYAAQRRFVFRVAEPTDRAAAVA